MDVVKTIDLYLPSDLEYIYAAPKRQEIEDRQKELKQTVLVVAAVNRMLSRYGRRYNDSNNGWKI